LDFSELLELTAKFKLLQQTRYLFLHPHQRTGSGATARFSISHIDTLSWEQNTRKSSVSLIISYHTKREPMGATGDIIGIVTVKNINIYLNTLELATELLDKHTSATSDRPPDVMTQEL
jgi:hypothetical protein